MLATAPPLPLRDLRYASLPVAVVTALDVDSEAVRRLNGIVQAVVQKGPALEQTLREVLHNVLGDGVRSPRGP